MSGYRVRIESGSNTFYVAPELADSLTTRDRFAARRYRSRLNADIAAKRWNNAAEDIKSTISEPAYVEPFE